MDTITLHRYGFSNTVASLGIAFTKQQAELLKKNKMKNVVVAFMGALFLIVVDTAARSLSGVEIPLSILTGLVGAPIFITMLYRQRRSVK